jgi:hypothetical protein
VTSRSACEAPRRRTISPLRARLAEASPKMLESTCSTFITVSWKPVWNGSRLRHGTVIDNPAYLEQIVPF